MGLSTQAGQYCMTRAIQLERLERVTFLNCEGILIALVLGYIFYQEKFDLISSTGILLVTAGIFLTSQKIGNKNQRNPIKRNSLDRSLKVWLKFFVKSGR